MPHSEEKQSRQLKNKAQYGGRERELRVKLFTFSSFILKERECYVSFPVFFKQHSFANGRKVTTIAFMKGAKQPQAFPKESPETAAHKKAI